MTIRRRIEGLEHRRGELERGPLEVWRQAVDGSDQWTGPQGEVLTRAALKAREKPRNATRMLVYRAEGKQ